MQEVNEMILNQLLKDQKSFALFVYTPMCGTCKLAERMLNVTSEALPTVSIYQLNINTAHAFVEHCQVTSVPALLLFEKGELVAQHYAIQSVAFLYDVLKPFV
ncbi:thioredoxin family protein [Brevibacillus sp. NRS-1366]|uniref:thioredoxin family protein n=1 Tax=Brevibacillus sp. NRS-1366 TaxID=3233899 RepID=UPI003D1A80D7